jgi:phage-related protein (TIGR01555 family)
MAKKIEQLTNGDLANAVAAKRLLDLKARADGWLNIYTKLGDDQRDKRRGVRFSRDWIDEIAAEELWLGDDMAAKIVEKPSDMMLRQGFGFTVNDLEPAGPTVEPMFTADAHGRLRLNRKRLHRDGAPDVSPEAQAGGTWPSLPPGSPLPVDPLSQTPMAQPVPNAPDPLIGSVLRREPYGGSVAAELEEEEMESAEKKRVEEELVHAFDELSGRRELKKSLDYARAYGGAGIFLGVDDGEKDLKKPLNEKRLKSVNYLTVLRPRECWPRAWNTNPLSPTFGQPVRYLVRRDAIGGAGQGFEVHATRVIRVQGVEVSRRQLALNRGWGASIFTRIFQVLADFNSNWSSTAALIQDFAQAVWGMEGLAELMSAGVEGENTVVARARAADIGRSVMRAMIIDSKETFERKQTPVSGLPELLDRWNGRLAAAADIPKPILFAEKPEGVGNNGDSTLRGYYDDIAARREMNAKPIVRRIARLILLSANGPTEGVEPRRWSVTFPPLWQATDLEESQKRKNQSDADVAYVNAGILSADEVAISRFGGGAWSGETHLDMHARSVMSQAAEEHAADPYDAEGNAKPLPFVPGAPDGAKPPLPPDKRPPEPPPGKQPPPR